jgi:hypothetical protein
MTMSSLARVLTLSLGIAFCATTSVPSFAGQHGAPPPTPHGNSASGAAIDSNKGGERRGLDRADDVAGDHGRQGRENARDNQDRRVPADSSECKKGGWRSFGFKNEGQCVSHITSHRK